jgi:hypothetical protein
MLFIEDFEEAKTYHKSVLDCWLRIKLKGRKSEENEVGYNCGKESCSYCNSRTQIFELRNEELCNLLYDNVDILLEGNIQAVIEFYNLNTIILDSNYDTIKSLFENSGYENYFQKKHGLNFLNKLNISTCVYCNRNYTLQLVANHSRAQLDHWLPKTHFPFAALNFYNLIPSCQSCNHIKGEGGDKEWWLSNYNTLIHPYVKEEIYKFSFSYIEDSNLLSVEINSSNERAITTAEINRIKEIYSAHNELELRDLYDLRMKYDDNYLEMLNKSFFNEKLSDEDKYRLVYGIEKEEAHYHKRPFSKFKNDIIEELMRIK